MYESAVSSFENFRLYYNLSNIWPVPLSDIVNFIAYLEKMNYKASTAKSYISVLSFKMKVMAIQDTTKSFVITKIVCGMERKHKRVNARKPITFEILEKITNVVLHVCNSYYEATLFAACFSVAFFGFLRVGEFALSQNSERHMLRIEDISLEFGGETVILNIPSSKTDQLANTTKLVINSCNNRVICPVKNMINYFNARPKVQGALFCHLNHKYLTRYQVVSVLKNTLTFLKLNPNDFNTHSFRIGAATSFSVLGKSDDEIKKLGRWKSSAFSNYIRI